MTTIAWNEVVFQFAKLRKQTYQLRNWKLNPNNLWVCLMQSSIKYYELWPNSYWLLADINLTFASGNMMILYASTHVLTRLLRQHRINSTFCLFMPKSIMTNMNCLNIDVRKAASISINIYIFQQILIWITTCEAIYSTCNFHTSCCEWTMKTVHMSYVLFFFWKIFSTKNPSICDEFKCVVTFCIWFFLRLIGISWR